MLVEDRYIVLYGGTNGFKFFDNIVRYDIKEKRAMLMTKYPNQIAGSNFLQDGRIASSCCQSGNKYGIIFGGCSAAEDSGDFLLLPFASITDDSNFSDISVIM
jgi:hypothetical protein